MSDKHDNSGLFEQDLSTGGGRCEGMSRRALLKGSLGTAAAGLLMAGGRSAEAQYTGIMPGGGTVPLRLPMGAMNYLDRNQYIHNMEIVSFLEGPGVAGGEPLMTMWARGDRRLLPSRQGWVDVSDPRNPSVVKASGDVGGCIVYNTRLGKWLMLTDHGEPLSSANPEFPHGQYSEELRRRAVSYDGLRGIRVWDISDPESPDLMGEFSTGDSGDGTHSNFYDGGRYAYLDAGWSSKFRMENAQRPHSNGMMIVDMSDPANIVEVSRYHVPGQLIGEEEEYKKYPFAGDHASWTGSHGGTVVPVRVEDGGTVGYQSFGAFGMYMFDLSDIRNPKVLGIAKWDFETLGGIPYHTIYPVIAPRGHRLHNIIVALAEPIEPDCREPFKPVKVIDVNDPTDPRFIGLFPRPKPPEEAPYTDFCLSRGRFGTHNCQSWVAPGTSKPEIMVTTWFNAGVRVHDISDPTNPREVAYFIPPRGGQLEDYGSWRRGDTETVFVEWDRNLIWIGTHAGSYCLSCPALGEPVQRPRAIDHWTKPYLNAGWDD